MKTSEMLDGKIYTCTYLDCTYKGAKAWIERFYPWLSDMDIWEEA